MLKKPTNPTLLFFIKQQSGTLRNSEQGLRYMPAVAENTVAAKEEEAVACSLKQRAETRGVYMECSCLLQRSPS